MKNIDPKALFRLSVLGPLASRERLERGELQQLIRELSSREYAIPDSKRRHLGEKTIEETSDLGWETDKTGNSSLTIAWNQGYGFTHPTLTSVTRTELLIRLKYDRSCTPEDYADRSIPCYGRPSLSTEISTQKELALFEALAV